LKEHVEIILETIWYDNILKELHKMD
jgi:hypothetical protein